MVSVAITIVDKNLAFIDYGGDRVLSKTSFSPFVRVAMHSTLKAPYAINERALFDYEIILVGGGQCNIVVEGVPHLCRKNDVVLLPPGVSHRFECVPGVDFVQPHIHFDIVYDEFSEWRKVCYKKLSAMSMQERERIHPDVLRELCIPAVFSPYDPERFHRLFFEVISIYQKREYNYELRYKAVMLELLALICEQFDPVKTPGPRDGRETLVAVKSYIDNNYRSPITLELLSDQFYLNKFTLMRRFKALYGKSIIEYYHDLRAEYAKRVLASTDLSVAEVGEKMHFSDVYSFSRFFKSAVGCSPSDYRQKCREEE